MAYATPAPGQSTSIGGTTVTRMSSAAAAGQPGVPNAAATAAANLASAADAAAEQRNAEIRREIEQSKYLGGDAKHTHLVKGLDFALLQKVRQEITTTDKEDEEKQSKLAKEQVMHPRVPYPKSLPFAGLSCTRTHQ